MENLDYTSIPAAGNQCITCGKDLVGIQKHPTVLSVTEKGEAQRQDICEECWEKVESGEIVTFWLNLREPPKPDTRRTRAQQREALRQLFERFVASGDERLKIHIYVMAHLLMKHRLLVWKGSERDESGKEKIVFQHPVTEERMLVDEVMDLDDEKLLAVKREIDHALVVAEIGREESSEEEEDLEEEAGEDGEEGPIE